MTIFAFLLIFDCFAYYSALLAAYSSRKLLDVLCPELHPLSLSLSYFTQLWWIPLVYLSFIAYERLYIKRLPFWDETKELAKAVTIATLSILAIITMGKMMSEISRLTVLILWGYSLIFFPVFRLIGKRILYRTGLWSEKVIILGAGMAGIAAAKGIQTEAHLGYTIIGFLDDSEEKKGTTLSIDGNSYKIFGSIKHYLKFIKHLNINTVVIALPSLPVEKLAYMTSTIQKHAKNIMLIPDVKGIALTNTELYHLFSQELFLLNIKNNLRSPTNRFIKRAFDIVVSLSLLPILVPLISVLGMIIKFNSPGPILYKQRRVGQDGRTFGIYKFRSMYRDAKQRLEHILRADPHAKKEWDTSYKLKNDPRITPVGTFLRRTSLDELPQIINVLLGNMSLVGPRPVVDEELHKYYKEYSDYYRLVRPGITGLWQVSGRNDIDYPARVRLDVWYVLNWSLWLDILLLFKTVRIVLKKEGAY